MVDRKSRIRSIIYDQGLYQDYLIAERSFKLYREITTSYKDLDKSKIGMAKILINLTYNDTVLALNRIYQVKGKDKTRCIDWLYEEIKKSDFNIELGDLKKESLFHFPTFGFYPEEIALYENVSDYTFNKRTYWHFLSLESSPPIDEYKLKLKKIRDKFLAHNEAIELDLSIPHEMVEDLLMHARQVIGFYSLTYGGIHALKNGGNISISTDKWVSVYRKFVSTK
ncbi:hypothetical protein [Salinimicrobium sp. GXAS 041]|uniref:hypothetical protein n=1 Tax=Salinimicrobium sp. GXAS 041 TaxID=3400806 RepID=UPI003C77AC6A